MAMESIKSKLNHLHFSLECPIKPEICILRIFYFHFCFLWAIMVMNTRSSYDNYNCLGYVLVEKLLMMLLPFSF